MASVAIKNKGEVVCSKLKIASSFFDRLIGLMFSSQMSGFDGLLIKHCQSIHTFFMRYSIDIIFLDNKYKVVKVIRNIKPWRVTGYYWRASQVLELPAGTLGEEIVTGTELEVRCIN